MLRARKTLDFLTDFGKKPTVLQSYLHLEKVEKLDCDHLALKEV